MTSAPDACMAELAEQVPTVFFSENYFPGEIIIDSGCRRSVANARWHAGLQRALQKQGLQGHQVERIQRFRFGSGHEETATESWDYPCRWGLKLGSLTIALVKNDSTLSLLSRRALKDLKVSVDFGRNLVQIGDQQALPLKFRGGHPVLKINVPDADVPAVPQRYRLGAGRTEYYSVSDEVDEKDVQKEVEPSASEVLQRQDAFEPEADDALFALTPERQVRRGALKRLRRTTQALADIAAQPSGQVHVWLLLCTHCIAG